MITATAFVPQLWSARLVANLDRQLIALGLVNTDYEGEITAMGDTVRIRQLGDLTVQDYTKGTPLDYTNDGTPVTMDLTINQAKAVAFRVEDIDAVQSNIALVDRYSGRAAMALAQEVDEYIFSLYTEGTAGTVDHDAGDDIYSAIVKARTNLSKNNVGAGRFLVVTPEVYAELLENEKFIHATASGDQTLATGQVGSIAGFDVFESNSVVTAGDVHNCLYGQYGAIAYANQMSQMEALRDKDQFDTLVRGLFLFGAKTIQPTALGTFAVDLNPE